VGLLYSNTFGHLAVSAGITYYQDTDGNPLDGNVYAGAGYDQEDVWGASLGMRDTNSGIYGQVAYFNYENSASVAVVPAPEQEIQTWYAKIGIRNNWSGMGETDIYAQWQHADLSGAPGAIDDEADMYGVGIGQDIDAVGATAYLSWKHYELDSGALDDLDTITAGMVVPF
jgi:hypothetical protein